MLAVVVAGEELDRIGGIAEDGQHTLDGHVGKHVVWGHLARDTGRSMAPHVEVKLLNSGQTRAARLVRSRARNRATPIIFVTGLAWQEDEILHAYTLGAVDFLVKPIRSEDVAEMFPQAPQIARTV